MRKVVWAHEKKPPVCYHTWYTPHGECAETGRCNRCKQKIVLTRGGWLTVEDAVGHELEA